MSKLSDEEPLNVFYESYLTLRKINPKQALKKLEIHCKAIGGDELHTKHFIYLMENGALEPNPDIQAADYSRIYKEQIAKGKSGNFAHKYSDLKAGKDYSELGCFAEAAEYEKAINSGYSEKFAAVFAMKISEYIANNYARYEDAVDDILYKEQKAYLEKLYNHLK